MIFPANTTALERHASMPPPSNAAYFSWTHLDIFGQRWTVLDGARLRWTDFDSFGLKSTILDRFGPFRTLLDSVLPSSTDHSTQNEVEVVWRDRPICETK